MPEEPGGTEPAACRPECHSLRSAAGGLCSMRRGETVRPELSMLSRRNRERRHPVVA
jgi:hypothetical protein